MRLVSLVPVLAIGVILGCGGGGGDNGGTTNPPPPATVSSVSLSKTTAVLKPTETTTITATPKDASGNSLTGRTVTWTVSPTSGVADIAPNGASVTVTATANGQATVTATVEQKTANATITVTSSFATAADVAVGANGANAFDPAQVDIAKNGTVTFNWSGVTHNVTWQSPPAQVANIGDRSTGSVPVNFTTTGTYNYQCTIHPGMNGVVTVH